jgi:lysophospholipase L1-like esterase
MTEEYAYELPFSAPDSDPTNANVRNWPELLRIFRPNDATLGPYKTGVAYADLRDGGHERNFGIPGFTTANWVNLLNTTNPFNYPSGEPLGPLYYPTRNSLIEELKTAQVIVILLGANDLKQQYNDIFNNTESPAFFSGIVSRIEGIYDWVKVRQNVPVVLCTIPDVGATPDVSSTYNDPVRIASAREKIAAMNASIVALAARKGEHVARLDLVTNRVFDEHPLQINGTVFTLAGDPENPPDHVFCKDGFHPATMAQALIANQIIGALNEAKGTAIPAFSNREILKNLLGLNPDQPYLTWAQAHGASADPAADTDGDGIPNLAEYLLGSSPVVVGSPFTGEFSPAGFLAWHPDAVAARFGDLIPEESTDLKSWSTVPETRLTREDSGEIRASPAAGAGAAFFRLRAEAKP